ncbi:unnamed protein product [Plutella xylostella]|uniref:(diamondback moth) hypothetical protein n=1 Tax=Plutella xylostella TaxID=51655 RepID=A0A8S4E129_PLUXY|nr:unnamed protein product [Plutella xylostella]
MSERHRSVLLRHEEGHTGRHNNVATPLRQNNVAAPHRRRRRNASCALALTLHCSSDDDTGTLSYVKAIDVWMSSCSVFVFLSLFEFAVVNN